MPSRLAHPIVAHFHRRGVQAAWLQQMCFRRRRILLARSFAAALTYSGNRAAGLTDCALYDFSGRNRHTSLVIVPQVFFDPFLTGIRQRFVLFAIALSPAALLARARIFSI